MILSLVRALTSAFKARRKLALENVALRQQLAVLRHSVKRPCPLKDDRVVNPPAPTAPVNHCHERCLRPPRWAFRRREHLAGYRRRHAQMGATIGAIRSWPDRGRFPANRPSSIQKPFFDSLRETQPVFEGSGVHHVLVHGTFVVKDGRTVPGVQPDPRLGGHLHGDGPPKG